MSRKPTAVLSGTVFLASTLLAAPIVAPPVPQSDLDAFMQKVLAKRDENWKKLQQYILDEREQVDIHGPNKVPIWGERREYTWFIKDGFFIRSPVKVNGVSVNEAERLKAEDNYLKHQKTREKRRRDNPDAAQGETPPVENAPADVREMGGVLMQTRQPEFMDSAYFLRFKFEQGKYALVGKETFEGREVLRIEYYPARLFSHEQERQDRRQQQGKTDREKDYSAQIEKMMNKVSLITLWIEPKSYQIVKYTFDNVNMDFLPAAWLVRMDDLKASMTMSQPFKRGEGAPANEKDIWLPRDVDMYFSAMFAVGLVDVRYHLDYRDYREAKTSSRIKTPEARQ